MIATGSGRKSIQWNTGPITVSGLYSRLEAPIRGVETLAQYLALSRGKQDDLKDVGGFVGGALKGPRRKADNVDYRDVVTLDLDTIPPFGTENVVSQVENLGCGFCIYSTRKHRQEAPRLRVIIPIDRSVTPDEYDAISRALAARIGIQMADPTTFESCRLMYWPSCCSDGEFVFRYKDAPLIGADQVLGSYTDWRNWNERPQVPGAATNYKKLAVKQGDPEEKPGMVGYFNRTYDVLAAMEKFLPGIYEPTDNDPDRYTYLEGSTTGGAIIYDGGKFLYSHHATDPCSDKLVNAFDLVRLHKFGQLDDNAQADTPVNRLPSFGAMCELAVGDPAVAALITQERRDTAMKDFSDLLGTTFGPDAETPQTAPVDAENDADTADAEASGETVDWTQRLERSPKSGEIKPTIDNVLIILENDPLLKGRFALNQFAGRGEVLGKLPWEASGKRRMWSDTDSNGMYWYLEKVYRISGRGNIDAALDIHAATHAFNEVQDYLNSLAWDGTPRLDTVLTDYLGAVDTPYTRAVCRKIFVAAVARAMEPGCKFDNMLILCGPQGIGKSTLIKKMAHGWFTDSVRTFEGKEASELLQGVWLVEVAELDAFRRTEVSRIKQFLSLNADRYRAAYAHNAKEFPRCCVFFGTSNESNFLQDMTGNRRFWPVDVGVMSHFDERDVQIRRNVFKDLTDDVITQIWAEAKMRWIIGEPLFLTGEAAAEAMEAQEAHREASTFEGLIEEFASREIPDDWQKWDLDKRRMFWSQTVHDDNIKLVPRDRITAIEVWCELFNSAPKDLNRTMTRDINAILQNMKGWKRIDTPFKQGPYNSQRGFKRRGT